MEHTYHSATLAGVRGSIVGADETIIQWEVDLVPSELGAVIGKLSRPADLPMLTNRGMVSVRARRWWVWPGHDSVKVRIALEESSAPLPA